MTIYALLALGRFLDHAYDVVAFVADLRLADGLEHGHALLALGRFQDRLGDRVAALPHFGLVDRAGADLAMLVEDGLVLQSVGGCLVLLVLRLINEPVFASLAAQAAAGRTDILGRGRQRSTTARRPM